MGFLIATLAVFFVLLTISYLWDGYWNWVVDKEIKSFGGAWVFWFTFLGYAIIAATSVLIVLLAPFLWVVALFVVAAFILNGFAKKLATKVRTLIGRLK